MKEITIRFHDFTLILNVDQQFVLHINWLGQVERYSMEQYFQVCQKVKALR